MVRNRLCGVVVAVFLALASHSASGRELWEVLWEKGDLPEPWQGGEMIELKRLSEDHPINFLVVDGGFYRSHFQLLKVGDREKGFAGAFGYRYKGNCSEGYSLVLEKLGNDDTTAVDGVGDKARSFSRSDLKLSGVIFTKGTFLFVVGLKGAKPDEVIPYARRIATRMWTE